MAACAPIWFTKNTVFGWSHNDKTTDSDEKIAEHKSDAILRLYGCVAEERCKPAESLPVPR